MSLRTVVEARVSSQRLVQLTNPDNQAATALDSTRLDAACSDAAGEFQIYAQTVFNEADPRHIAPAVDLVILTLQERGAAPAEGLGAQREKIVQRLKDLSLVTGRNRILPESAKDTSETFSDDVFENTLVDPQPPTEEE
ncbi:MAG TPA: hypothetical protein VJU16_05160 [Planctomycetota bacterium]|nr:hypothetical protein [Planctomycetota bacterium]